VPPHVGFHDEARHQCANDNANDNKEGIMEHEHDELHRVGACAYYIIPRNTGALCINQREVCAAPSGVDVFSELLTDY
jgi:hypothetical protein